MQPQHGIGSLETGCICPPSSQNKFRRLEVWWPGIGQATLLLKARGEESPCLFSFWGSWNPVAGGLHPTHPGLGLHTACPSVRVCVLSRPSSLTSSSPVTLQRPCFQVRSPSLVLSGQDFGGHRPAHCTVSPQSATQSAAPSILMLSRLMGGAGTTGSSVSEKLNLRVWCDFTAQSSPFLLLPCLVRALGNRPSGVRSPIKASPLCPAFAWHPRLFLRAACLAHPLDLVPPPGPHCSLTTLHPVLPGSLLLLPSCFFCLMPFPILPYLRHVVLG